MSHLVTHDWQLNVRLCGIHCHRAQSGLRCAGPNPKEQGPARRVGGELESPRQHVRTLSHMHARRKPGGRGAIAQSAGCLAVCYGCMQSSGRKCYARGLASACTYLSSSLPLYCCTCLPVYTSLSPYLTSSLPVSLSPSLPLYLSPSLPLCLSTSRQL